ncbi:MAG: hypothetical protein OXR72_09210, partial [Gemmatimonadota bacterium]|nr:hypothetical protein [Gemmatimonadota bacterium]
TDSYTPYLPEPPSRRGLKISIENWKESMLAWILSENALPQTKHDSTLWINPFSRNTINSLPESQIGRHCYFFSLRLVSAFRLPFHRVIGRPRQAPTTSL